MPKAAPELDRVRALVAYDPDLHNLRWLVDRPPVVKAGDPAGTKHWRDGSWGVTLDGTRYPSHYIVRYLDTGLWPSGRVGFKNQDKDNLAPQNLIDLSHRYSSTPQAISNRKRALRLRTARRAVEKLREENALRSLNALVRYNEAQGHWELCEPVTNYQLGAYPTMEAANSAFEMREYIARFLAFNPYRSLAGDDRLLSGSEQASATYFELANTFAYDPDTGHFFFRRPADKRKLVAEFYNSSGRLVVTFWGRQYPAAMLAWFLMKRQWPKRKSILPRDGDPDNLVFSNLIRTRP